MPFTFYNKILITVRNSVVCLPKFFCSSPFGRFSERPSSHNGISLTLHHFEDYTSKMFEDDIKEFIKKWKKNSNRSVFLQIPISMSHCMKSAADFGFEFHHAKGDSAVLTKWLIKTSANKIPSFANHTVGVAGVCYHEPNVLVVQDKGRFSDWWKFPGGYSDDGEYIEQTAVREVFEETGIDSEFKSILSFRQQHGGHFNQSDLYFICRLQPITFEIRPCMEEIHDCRWININEASTMNNATPLVKIACRLLLEGKNSSFKDVDIASHEMQSWIRRNKTLKLYYRSLPTL